ncbi:MAG: hypothetical protein QOF19_1113 [Alphaproteobacteria bacterium]|jgi:glycosyltransferase involved in cell wall biosynthesis|nr:hypothetical protein [Alphaproteobacteria bacterium]
MSRTLQPQSADQNSGSIDITLVVNVHAGIDYLKRTMLSLEEASRFAASFGLRCELLFVMDLSPPELLNWVETYRSDAFSTKRIIEVSNGSLGLSRNDGLLGAMGGIVLFCDEDDLVSYNMVCECYFLAKAEGPKAVVVPEYFVVFGDGFYIQRYFGTGTYSAISFMADHPFTSRICIHQSVGKFLLYSDVRLSSGYAYEDYHFNSKLAALGFRFVVAPKTIIFYRRRRLGLQYKMQSISTNQIPPTPLFEPPTYLKVCARDYIQRDTLHQLHKQTMPKAAEFFSDAACLEFTHAANAIDPGIDIKDITSAPIGTNLAMALTPGIAYYRACGWIGSARFSDVVILPFLSRAGGEKYILNIINAIQKADANARPLVLCGQQFGANSWVEELPRNAVFLNLPSLHPELTNEDIDVLTLRLITSTASSARIHLKPCEYAHRFVEKFGRLLKDNELYYYRFCDGNTTVDGLTFVDGFSFKFLSENARILTGVIADNKSIVGYDLTRFDAGKTKWNVLHTVVEPLTQPKTIEARQPIFRRRLFWIGRLDRQKRPDLLLLIAEGLRSASSDVHIDVYGAPLLEAFDVTVFANYPNLSYHGECNGFEQIPIDSYDALINTSSFEGLPISILQAFSAGLPAIAPAIGGIGDVVVSGETGFLVKGDDEPELISGYMNAISLLYSDAKEFLRLRRNALDLITKNHSPQRFAERLADVFEIPMIFELTSRPQVLELSNND